MKWLGQTGEQVALAARLGQRHVERRIANYIFPVPAPDERVVVATLQRMYRHFYLRLCDVSDTARLVKSGDIDYVYLRSLAGSAGLWDGLATYLMIVSGYIQSYGGEALPLPSMIISAARFGNERVYFKRNFLRIPIFPQAASVKRPSFEAASIKPNHDGPGSGGLGRRLPGALGGPAGGPQPGRLPGPAGGAAGAARLLPAGRAHRRLCRALPGRAPGRARVAGRDARPV